jgi:hypothetical protein
VKHVPKRKRRAPKILPVLADMIRIFGAITVVIIELLRS